jgi:hypothetical protein
MIVKDKNGIVDVDEQFELSPEHKKDMKRLPHVAAVMNELAFRETPTVAVSACISVLSNVLLVAGGDPINEARIVGESLQVFVRQHLKDLHGPSSLIQ